MTPADPAALIHGVAELGHPEGELLDRLVDSIEWLRIPAGQRVFSEGDTADGMYILFEGRVRFVIESTPVAHTPWELDPVAVFGEGALLTRGGRSRTAVVVRDALLARLPPHIFEEVLDQVPGVAVAIARRVAMRTVFPAADERRVRVFENRVVVVSPSLPAVRLEHLRLAAVSAIGAHADVVVLGRDDQDAVPAAVRQSDRVLVVVDARTFTDVSAIVDIVRHGVDPLAGPTVELILLHASGSHEPSGTARWLSGHEYAHHTHIREGSAADLARFSRHLSGKSVGLVLGGGGARGLAHIGVVRAMRELSIPIDTVGGTSIGAILGGQLAMGWTWEEMLERNDTLWNERHLRWDFTVPTVSLFSGKRTRRVFEEIFGDREIEDFWLPFFCTSVDLSAFRLAVHCDGNAAQWIRASATVAGLWPPVVDAAGHLHVDGGQLNNMPTDYMRDHHDGPIVAVDVFARQAEMTLEPGAAPPVGLRHLAKRRASQRYPAITDTLNRCALLGSLAHQEGARRHADYYVTPDLRSIGFRRFDRIRAAAEIGYSAAMEALSGWPDDRPVLAARDAFRLRSAQAG